MRSIVTNLALALAAAWLISSGTAPSASAADKETPKVEEGKPAPDVELPATSIDTVFPDRKDAKTINLKDFQGKKNVVLYFYPKAMTGG
jgi:cytochrome oxidase Cu insertion factor (SCO1/SenC/PrrC family)